MESNRLNKWLSLGANFGVLIGIILLVVELDQNRDMLRAQTRNDISRQLADFLGRLSSNPELASLVRRAEAGEELSTDEEFQHLIHMAGNLRLWENIHYQYRQGLFDEAEFQAERETWRFLITKNQRFKAHWCGDAQSFSSEFVAEINQLMPEGTCARLNARNSVNGISG